MKIAITYDNGYVFQHFGHTEKFQIFEIENNKIKETYLLDCNGVGHCALVNVLIEEGIDSLICGGVGGGAISALNKAKIKVFPGVHGEISQIIQLYLNNELCESYESNCDHHDENHHKNHEHHCNHKHGCSCHDE